MAATFLGGRRHAGERGHPSDMPTNQQGKGSAPSPARQQLMEATSPVGDRVSRSTYAP
jgi:hypothetical protein